MADDIPERRYTDDEARAVFERALTTESDGRLGHEELVAAAAEVGLSREAVERAVSEMQVAQAERDAKRTIIARRHRRLRNHLVPFLAVNGFLFLINWLTSPGAWWFLFPLCCWGLGLFFHAWAALSREVSPKALRRELARVERQQRYSLGQLLREDQRARRHARHQRIETGAKLLGEAVEEGMAALLGKLADELGQGKRAPKTGVRVEPSPPEPVRAAEEPQNPAEEHRKGHSRG